MPKKTIEPTIDNSNTPVSYEAASQELDALVRQMESAQLPLDELLSSYQRGAFLLQFCQSKLQLLSQQVSQIDNGQIKPWLNAQ